MHDRSQPGFSAVSMAMNKQLADKNYHRNIALRWATSYSSLHTDTILFDIRLPPLSILSPASRIINYEKNEKICDVDGRDGLLQSSGRAPSSLLPPFLMSCVHLEKGAAVGLGLHSSMLLLHYEWCVRDARGANVCI